LANLASYNTNIEIKTIVLLEISDAIFLALKDKHDQHALIAFGYNVEGFY